MSLVPTFVELNGVWLKNPVVRSIQGDWFLCFDDDEPPEVVIQLKSIHHTDTRSGFEIADCTLARLKAAGIHAEAISSPKICDRVFGKIQKHTFKAPACRFYRAAAFFIDIKAFYPNQFATVDNDGILRMDDIDRPEGVYYSLNRREG